MKNFKIIDDYFSDNLTAERKEEFELELTNDNELRKDYDNYRASQNLIEFMIQEDLLGKLPQLVSDDEDLQYASQYKVIDEDSELTTIPVETAKIVSIDQNASRSTDHSSSNYQRSSFRKVMRIAASFLIIAVCGSLVWMNIRSNDFSQITQDNIVYVDMSQMRSGEKINENYNKLLILNEQRNYNEANKTIDMLIAADPSTYNYLIYFKAQNNFRMKNFTDADKQFDQVIRSDMSKYIEDAQLMRVYTAIELDDPSLAKTRIEELEVLPMYSYKEVLAKIKNEL